MYDPKVTGTQMLDDLDYLNTRSQKENASFLQTNDDPYKALEGAHAVAVLTEWDEFKTTIGRLSMILCKNPPLSLTGVIF